MSPKKAARPKKATTTSAVKSVPEIPRATALTQEGMLYLNQRIRDKTNEVKNLLSKLHDQRNDVYVLKPAHIDRAKVIAYFSTPNIARYIDKNQLCDNCLTAAGIAARNKAIASNKKLIEQHTERLAVLTEAGQKIYDRYMFGDGDIEQMLIEFANL